MLSGEYTPGSIAGLLQHQGQPVGDDKETNKLQQLFSQPRKKKEKRLGDLKLDKRPSENRASDEEGKWKKKKRKTQAALTVRSEGDEESAETSTTEKKVFPKKDPKRDMRTVFLGNLPKTVTKKKVLKMFRKYGKIESVRFRSAAPADPKLPKKATIIKRDFHEHRHNLNAYVVFEDVESTSGTLERNGSVMDGLHIRVDLLGSQTHDHNRSIFLGNLAFDIEEEAVRGFFSQCGDVENVRLIRDKLLGIGKGFGYVLFKNKDSVLLALELDGEKLKGRKLRVEQSSQQAIVAHKVEARHRGQMGGVALKKVPSSRATAGRKPQKKQSAAVSSGTDGDIARGKGQPKDSFREQKTKHKKKQKLRQTRKQHTKVAAILQGQGKTRERRTGAKDDAQKKGPAKPAARRKTPS